MTTVVKAKKKKDDPVNNINANNAENKKINNNNDITIQTEVSTLINVTNSLYVSNTKLEENAENKKTEIITDYKQDNNNNNININEYSNFLVYFCIFN